MAAQDSSGATKTTRVRRGRAIRVIGLILCVLAVGLGIVCGVRIVAVVARPIGDALSAPARQTPLDAQLPLQPGQYTVFQLTGEQHSVGNLRYKQNHAPTITPADVQATGPDGQTITATSAGPMTETLTRGTQIYTGAVHLDVKTAGGYRVQIVPAGSTVIIAPSIGTGFASVVPWIAAALVSALVFLLGLGLFIAGLFRGRRAAAPGLTPTTLPTTVPPETAHPVAAPPGWYPDRNDPHHRRYWDGQAWTPHVR